MGQGDSALHRTLAYGLQLVSLLLLIDLSSKQLEEAA